MLKRSNNDSIDLEVLLFVNSVGFQFCKEVKDPESILFMLKDSVCINILAA